MVGAETEEGRKKRVSPQLVRSNLGSVTRVRFEPSEQNHLSTRHANVSSPRPDDGQKITMAHLSHGLDVFFLAKTKRNPLENQI